MARQRLVSDDDPTVVIGLAIVIFVLYLVASAVTMQ